MKRKDRQKEMIKCYDKISYVPIEQIVPYFNNARNNEAAIDALVKAIPIMGFNVPLVLDKNNVIVKGHSRLEALKKLGVELVPCIIIDGDDDLIAEERLLDNKLSELAEWDEEKLKYELREIQIDLGRFDIQLPQIRSEAQTVMPVTQEQVHRAQEEIVGSGRKVASEKKSLVEIHCPHCGEDFFADIKEVERFASES